jgi:hypothetical protein
MDHMTQVTPQSFSEAIKAAQKRNFDVNDAIALLLEQREEAFRGERGTRLFQLQTWIMFPSETNTAPDHAGRIAAAAILRTIEDENFPEEDEISAGVLGLLLQNASYKTVYDRLVAHGGGWSCTILDCIGPAEFDERIAARAKDITRAVRILEVRLRLAQNHPELARKATLSRGIAILRQMNPEIEDSPRTNWGSWTSLKRSAFFNYIIERHDFDMRPPRVSDPEKFIEFLFHPQISVQNLQRLFGMSIFAAQQLGEMDKLPSFIRNEVPPVEFRTERLSDKELEAAHQHQNDDFL